MNNFEAEEKRGNCLSIVVPCYNEEEMLPTTVAVLTELVEKMIADGVDTFIEIGPGKTLAGFMKRINKEVKVYNVGTIEELDKLLEEIGC